MVKTSEEGREISPCTLDSGPLRRAAYVKLQTMSDKRLSFGLFPRVSVLAIRSFSGGGSQRLRVGFPPRVSPSPFSLLPSFFRDWLRPHAASSPRVPASPRQQFSSPFLLLPSSFLLLLLLIPSCSSGPPEELFVRDIQTMAMIEEEMGFAVQVDEVRVLESQKVQDRMEVEVEVTGWASHPELTIGAVLPASPGKRQSRALWKYFCRKVEKEWILEEKYKVREEFLEAGT